MLRILVIAAVALCLFAAPAKARSKAADYLVREQIAAACDGGRGEIEPYAVIERDLTGDGKADLIISHEGIVCSSGGRSSFCGAQVCSVNIYVRKGALLDLEREMLGMGVEIRDASPVPMIDMFAHGGKRGSIRWEGSGFR